MLWLAALLVLWVTGRRAAVRELALLLPNLARLFHGLLRDERVPLGSKVLVAIGLAWIASPVDLIPEFIPVIGPLDDAVVGALILRHVLRTAGETVVNEHWHGDRRVPRAAVSGGRGARHPVDRTAWRGPAKIPNRAWELARGSRCAARHRCDRRGGPRYTAGGRLRSLLPGCRRRGRVVDRAIRSARSRWLIGGSLLKAAERLGCATSRGSTARVCPPPSRAR